MQRFFPHNFPLIVKRVKCCGGWRLRFISFLAEGGINVEKGSLSSICSNGNDFPKPRQVEQYSKVSLVEMICMNRGVES